MERRHRRGPDEREITSEANQTTIHERFQRLVGRDHPSIRALALLMEEYVAIWPGSSALEKLSERAEAYYHSFENQQILEWVEGEYFSSDPASLSDLTDWLGCT